MTLSVGIWVAGVRILCGGYTKTCASVMAVNMWKNNLKTVASDNNKILYKTLIFFTAKRYLLSE